MEQKTRSYVVTRRKLATFAKRAGIDPKTLEQELNEAELIGKALVIHLYSEGEQ